MFAQHSKSAVEFTQTFFACRIQLGTTATEGSQQLVLQALPFPIICWRGGLLKALVEHLVLVEGITVFRQFRDNLLGDGVHFGGRIGAVQVEKHRADALECAARGLQGFHGVSPCCRLGVVNDGVDFRFMVKQGGVECRQEMLDLYIRKRRQLERKLTRSDKGVRKIVGVAMGICLSGHIRHASEKTTTHAWWVVAFIWCALTGSNRRPAGCKPAALPAELKARNG